MRHAVGTGITTCDDTNAQLLGEHEAAGMAVDNTAQVIAYFVAPTDNFGMVQLELNRSERRHPDHIQVTDTS